MLLERQEFISSLQPAHSQKTGQTGLSRATNLEKGHVEIQIYEKGKDKSLLSFPKTTMSMQNLDIKRKIWKA